MINRKQRPLLYQPGHNLVHEVETKYGPYIKQMDNADILAAFGLKSPIPPDFEGVRHIGDTLVYIFKRGEAKRHYKKERRVLAGCNHCGKLVCAGHLRQHLRSH